MHNTLSAALGHPADLRAALRGASPKPVVAVSLPVPYDVWGQDTLTFPVRVEAIGPFGEVRWSYVEPDAIFGFSRDIANELEFEVSVLLRDERAGVAA